MGAEATENLIWFLTGGLLVYVWLLVRHAWAHRRQPIRRDAPTGREPWVTPQPKVRR